MTERHDEPKRCDGYWNLEEGTATFGQWECPTCRRTSWQLVCGDQTPVEDATPGSEGV